MNSNHITNIPEVVTAAAVAALSGPQDVPTHEERRVPGQARPGDGGDGLDCRAWSARGRRARSTCSRTSACAFGKTHGPSGTKIDNDVDFCNALLEAKGVACVPGSAFGEPRALRISYTCPTPQLAPGLQRFQEFFDELS